MLQIIYKLFRSYFFINFQGKNPWRYFRSQGFFKMKNIKEIEFVVGNWEHECLDLNLLKNDAT